MREDRISIVNRRGFALIIAVATLISWLVVQNGTLLLLWSWPAMPALLPVGRALLKVGVIVAFQLLPAALVAGGVAMLWVAARRAASSTARRFEEVRHG